MPRNRSIDYMLPEDAAVLRDATKLACARANATSAMERDRIADTVLWLARCGYARHSDGTLDAGVLADAAIMAGGVVATTPVNGDALHV
jgi:hypothetical protein